MQQKHTPDVLIRCITFPGKFTRRGSTDTAADADSLSAKHSHSHHSLLRDMPDHSNSHSDNTVKEGKEEAGIRNEQIKGAIVQIGGSISPEYPLSAANCSCCYSN